MTSSRPLLAGIGLIASSIVYPRVSSGQSTFASLLGTVHDPFGTVVSHCLVTIENTRTSAKRSVTTEQDDSYSVPNLEPGNYRITMAAVGFPQATYTVELLARQTVRVAGQMSVTSQSQTVNVAESAPVLNTDVSKIAETETDRELVDLPVAIATRASGSTTPMSTLTTQPGVQTDSSGNISVAGTKPAMVQMCIDRISSMGPRTNGPITEMFPSFNFLAEIRVSEIDNAAEFGGISDLTTISKSGTNSFHGGRFENLQNTDMNARNPFNAVKPTLNMNDFGAYGDGRISRDRTFFFASYEGLRIVGGWGLAEHLMFQSGAFLTVTVPGADPSGTGFPQIIGNGRADIFSGAPRYPTKRSIQEWVNPAAFAVPPNNVGRCPYALVGDLVGPGTHRFRCRS